MSVNCRRGLFIAIFANELSALFAHLFDQSACYYSFAYSSTNQRAIAGFFCIVYGTSTHHDTGLIAHSSMELKCRY